jgi:two-component system, OmpR family, KDP operon response regulator KdpE
MTNESRLRVLVVDDESAIRRFLRTSLGAEGYTISLAANGQEALAEATTFRPDLIILDLGLPDMDGLEILQRLREHTVVPIIILSVREEERVKVRVLDAGADDYVTKPFGTAELLARMRVVMRRPSQAAEAPVFSMEDLTVDLSRRLVTVRGREVQLTPTECDLLRALTVYPGKVLTHHQLIQKLWGDGHADSGHLLRVNISNLRRKLEADPMRPRYIVTEAGVGYRLRAPG